MEYILKLHRNALAHEARLARSAEGKAIHHARLLSGKYQKKHQLDEPRPEPPIVKIPNDAVDQVHQARTLYFGLHHRRTHELRKEARAYHLALGFLRGVDYQRMEQFCYEPPDFNKVEKIIFDNAEYSHVPAEIMDLKQKFEEWTQFATGTHNEPQRIEAAFLEATS